MDFSIQKQPGQAYFELLVQGAIVADETILKWLEILPADQNDYNAFRELQFNKLKRLDAVNQLILDRNMIGFGLTKQMDDISRGNAICVDANNRSPLPPADSFRARASSLPTSEPSSAYSTTSLFVGRIAPAGAVGELVPLWSVVWPIYRVRGPMQFGVSDQWTTEEAERRVNLGRRVSFWQQGQPIQNDRWFSCNDPLLPLL